MSKSPWSPYFPSQSAPWNLARAWTLRRQAGFGATWAELQRDLADGPDAAVDRVLAGRCRIDGLPESFESTANLLGDAAAGSSDAERLKAWWLYRMVFTPDPLTERLTLMWHNHFATSQLKVQDTAAMRRQNETFRQHARGSFRTLLRSMLRDPALLVWLDAPENRRGSPNENLARELMELFTLGIGHYTETDVKEAARALTGRSVVDGRCHDRSEQHDDGSKTILGRIAKFDSESLADLLLDQPATAKRLAWRLCDTFLGEGVADEASISELANQMSRDELNIGRAVATILRSELFFSDRNLHTRVADPVGFIVGAVRGTESFRPPPSTLLLAEWSGRLGQTLFFPPNVGGWRGGRSWLTGRTVIARANFAAALARGELAPGAGPPDLLGLAARHESGSRRAEALRFYSDLLTGGQLGPEVCDAAWKSVVAGRGTETERFNQAVAILLARPEAQQ
jgi:uncharacterized protein (DUF1800 family)